MNTQTLPICEGFILAAGLYTVIAAIPSDAISGTLNFRAINTVMTVDSKVRVAIVSTAVAAGANLVTPPTAAQWIQPVDFILGPDGIVDGIMEDTGLVLLPGQAIVAYSDTGNITGHAHGLYKTTVGA